MARYPKLTRKKAIFVIFCFLSVYFVCILLIKNQKLPHNVPPRSAFQKIGNGTEKLYVYSAYLYTKRHSPAGAVTVIAGLKVNQSHLYCKLYNKNGSTVIVDAVLKPLNFDNIGRHNYTTYRGYSIICDVSRDSFPVSVSIIESRTEIVRNKLKIKYRNGDDAKLFDFAMCVPPTHHYDKPVHFAEFIEFYKMMGVEHFTFYNETIGAATSCVMKSYENENLLRVLPWGSPYVYEKEIREYGQLIAIHDCIQRYKGVAKYLIYIDLNQMIIPEPSTGNNYHEMMEKVQKYFDSRSIFQENISNYNFHSGFYFDGNITEDISNKLYKALPTAIESYNDKIYRNLMLSRKTFRPKKIESNGYRSNYILIPDAIAEYEAGNHTIIAATRTAQVPMELAYLHQFKYCVPDKINTLPDGWCGAKDKIVDNSAQKRFAKKISKKVSSQLLSKAAHCSIAML